MPQDRQDRRAAITARAGIVAAGTLASRVLGLGRDLVLAAMFTRAATDAFMVAFTIPNALRQLLAEGAVQNAVLPVLTQVRERDGEVEAQRFFRAVRGLSLLVLGVVTVAGVLCAQPLVELFAAGFHQEPGLFELTVQLTRWLFPYIFFMGTAAMGVAALNASGRFVVTAFAPALLNVACIAFGLLAPLLFSGPGSEPILAMALGALVGGVLQVVAQWPSLRAAGYFALPSLDFAHPGLREAVRRMGPVLLGLGVYYVDVVLARRFLSELELGSQTYFGFALRLCDFPQGIFVMAIQSATLPSLAALAARRDLDELGATFAFGLRLALFVALGATALFVALAEPLVVLLFQRGAFDAHAASETAKALVGQGLGIWLVAAVRQLVAVYFAVGDTKTPVLVSALDLGVFVVLALLLRGPLGHVGVSLAVTGASLAQMLMLWVRLGRHLPDLRLGEIARSAAKSSLSALLAAALTRAALHSALPLVSAPGAARAVPGLLGSVLFALFYLGSARLLCSEELATMQSALSSRLRRRR